jgi:hypothetical protein
VRGWILYILIFSIADDCFAFDQLIKIPTLLVHYVEHKEKDVSVSFLDFLSMHYGGTDLNDGDNDRDMQLPFKKLTQNFGFVSVVLSSPYIYLEKIWSLHKTTYFSLSGFIFCSLSQDSVFRPPCF